MKNHYSNIRIIFISGKSPNRIFTANIQYNLFEYSNNSNIRPNTALKDFRRGINTYTHGNQDSFRMSNKKVTAICWVIMFCEYFGQNAPDSVCTVIPHYFNIACLFQKYKTDIRIG